MLPNVLGRHAAILVTFYSIFKVVMCPPLYTGALSIVDPPNCKKEPSVYGTHCSLSCPPEYGIGGRPSGAYCAEDGQWHGYGPRIVCEGNECM